MFRELAPLLRQRAVLLTVTHLEEDQIRVNVLPKQVGIGENTALTTPFSVTGTAEELDEQLPQAFVQFVGKHLELKNTLEAAMLAKEEAKSNTKTTAKKPEPVPAKPEPPKPAPAPSLFDPLPEAAESTPPSSNEGEILKEIQDNEQSDDDTEHDLEDDPVAA